MISLWIITALFVGIICWIIYAHLNKQKMIVEYMKNADPINFWSDIIKLMSIEVINASSRDLEIPSKGPLIIKFRIEFPKQLTNEQKSALLEIL